ncbi:MAG TPA: hypothetical protein VHG28_09285, partial [Longimicrobiaceae bacterium]|nr:hypothetical protein [Longimicrobiaceae bacterium]
MLLHGVRGHGDHGDGGGARVGLEAAGGLEPADPRHADVHQDERGEEAGRLRQPFLARLRLGHLVAVV